jgi:hypothetical protein
MIVPTYVAGFQVSIRYRFPIPSPGVRMKWRIYVLFRFANVSNPDVLPPSGNSIESNNNNNNSNNDNNSNNFFQIKSLSFSPEIKCLPDLYTSPDKPVLTQVSVMYIAVRQHNFVYLRNINKLYFTKTTCFGSCYRQVYFCSTLVGWRGYQMMRSHYRYYWAVLYYNTKYTVSSLLVLGLSYLVAVGMISWAGVGDLGRKRYVHMETSLFLAVRILDIFGLARVMLSGLSRCCRCGFVRIGLTITELSKRFLFFFSIFLVYVI